jgi:hypothetical protein
MSINCIVIGHGFAGLKGYVQAYWSFILLLSILLPFYIRQSWPAFQIGMVAFAIPSIFTIMYPSLFDAPEWYMLTWPVLHIGYYVVVSSQLVGVYFAYRSYKQLYARWLGREIGKSEDMAAVYTSNQVGAIAAICTIAQNGIYYYGTSIILGFDHWFYPILIISAWILLPFVVQRKRLAFMAGIIVSAMVIAYIMIFPSLTGMEPWYLYTPRLYDFSYVIFTGISVYGIYFCYNAYKELK